ncbi:helix-turn-helix domain-containing protein [Kutzneria viridogrisea]|uniref:Transcriptional regulator with XRE-family HTH domain n=1 Tax=Kutzneria viridogrisea TaxID=47990 RepID=A0ABR6BVY8_9PSEU|nr:transcriptional regulator with XRE-family HTH domain [Kutzneria viridogrisea]
MDRSAHLGEHLRRLRAERGLTQRELAEPEFSRGYLWALEAGRKTPTDEVLRYLAGRLGVSEDDLRHGRPTGLAEDLRERLAQVRRRSAVGQVWAAIAEFAEIAREAAQAHLVEEAALATRCLAEARMTLGEAGQALTDLRTLGPTLTELSSPLWASVIAVEAAARYRIESAEAAITLLEKALGELRARPSAQPDAELRLESALIHPCLASGAVERARQAAERGRLLLAHAAEPEWIAMYHLNAGQFWQAVGELAEAERGLVTATRLYRELGMEVLVARCLWSRGYVLGRMDRLPEAREELAQARRILSEAGAVFEYAGATLEACDLARRLGDLDEAAALAEETRRLHEEFEYAEGLGEAHRLIGLIARDRGDLDAAESALRRSLDLQIGAGLCGEAVATARVLGALLLGVGQLAAGIAVLRRAVVAAEETG